MARVVKSLLCKHKAPGLIPRAHEKELGVMAHACNLSVGEVERGGLPRACWPASLANQ